MIAGYLLARAGVKVVVLEKHADFLPDFRGDAALTGLRPQERACSHFGQPNPDSPASTAA